MKIHIVKQGDTLWKIAQKYNLDFEKLKDFNKHIENPDKIFPGMKVKIPTDSVPIRPQFPSENQIQHVSEKKKEQLTPEQFTPMPAPEPMEMESPFMPSMPAPEPTESPFMPSMPAPESTESPFMPPMTMPSMPMTPIMPPVMPQFTPFCPSKHHHDCCHPMEYGHYPFPHYMAPPMPFPSGMPGMPPVPPAPNMEVENTPPGNPQPFCPAPVKKKKKGRNRN